jgi:hypothetical protein
MLPQIEQGNHCYNFYHSGYIVVAEDYPGGGPRGLGEIEQGCHCDHSPYWQGNSRRGERGSRALCEIWQGCHCYHPRTLAD